LMQFQLLWGTCIADATRDATRSDDVV
jgi:hypothetical protein